MCKTNKPKELEKTFKYGEGIKITPPSWISYFWSVHRKRVVEHVRSSVNEAHRIVFLGVGQGDVISDLSMDNKTVIGIDLNMESLFSASNNCNAVAADGAMLPVKSESVDLVICNMVLHHIVGQGDLEKALAECSRVLKRTGKLFIFEPNFFHPSGIALNAINTFHLYNKFAGGSNYEYALSPFKVSKICRSSSLKNVRLSALSFSHPRFPIFAQNWIDRIDKYLSRIYALSFNFMLEATKT